MRAAVIHGPEQLRLEERPVPEPGPGELVIRTLVASICNATDVHIWEGRLGEELRPPFPHVLGHERAGRVVAVAGDAVAGAEALHAVAPRAGSDARRAARARAGVADRRPHRAAAPQWRLRRRLLHLRNRSAVPAPKQVKNGLTL